MATIIYCELTGLIIGYETDIKIVMFGRNRKEKTVYLK